MKIGVGLTMMDRQYPGYIDSLVKYSEIGYDVLDYSMYSEGKGSIFLQDGWQAYAEKLREAADKNNLWFAQMHSPGMGSVGREPMEDVKLELTKRAFEFCSILGTKHLVIHPRLFTDGIYGHNQARILEDNLRFYDSLLPYARKYNVTIGLENMFSWDPQKLQYCPTTFSDVEEMLECIRRLGDEHVAVCFDTGHYNVLGKNPAEAVRILGDKLELLHVHDNFGNGDHHLAPGYGTINWTEFMQALKDVGYKGTFTAEAENMSRRLPADAEYDAAKLTYSILKALVEKAGM